ncbi:MAG TPA: histidinol-phosphate transaminase [Spirochaetia bacterium]|nr:histidinol-phosphate transaminase [Spirochaetia bacterium]
MGENIFSARLKSLVPYTAGEQPQDRSYIKLNTNENPYPPSPQVQEILGTFPAERLRLYPDPQCIRLREAVAEETGLEPENIFVGNGSDEVLSFAFFSFFDSTRGPLLFPRHTYSFFPVYCDFYRIEYVRVPLEEDFSLRLSRFLEEPESCGIAFPNPNAPIGRAVQLEEITRLLEQYPSDRLVLLDEAYVDFGAQTAVGLCRDWDNLLVVQTVSKGRSLAGIRLGFAFGQKPLIDALNAAKDSFNSYPVDAVAQEVGIAAMTDSAYYQSINSAVVATREDFAARLRETGWRVLPSKANFVFASHPTLSGEMVYTTLKRRGILVRYFAKEEINRFVRITIGRPEDMERFIEVVREL